MPDTPQPSDNERRSRVVVLGAGFGGIGAVRARKGADVDARLALLSTGEDRARAVVDSTWAGFAHERPGRITVRTDDERSAE